MAAPSSAPAPSVPEEREKQHLPPKSYADAVEESPIEQGKQTEGNGDGHQDGDGANATPYNPPQSSTRHKASVLRIVAPETQNEDKSEEKDSSRPDLSRGVSKEEYTATVCWSS